MHEPSPAPGRPRRALSLAALVGLQASATAVAGMLAALFVPHPAAVFVATAVTGGGLAAWAVHRWQREGARAPSLRRDPGLRGADFSTRAARWRSRRPS